MASNQAVTRRKQAELTSTIGAGVLGAGVALLFANYLASYRVTLLAAGLLVHGWGMFDKHRLERSSGDELPRWAVAMYWLCWAGLAALTVHIVWRSV